MATPLETREDSQEPLGIDLPFGEFLEQLEAGTADPRLAEWADNFAKELMDYIIKYTPSK